MALLLGTALLIGSMQSVEDAVFQVLAAEARVDVTALREASAMTGLPPLEYLRMTGELAPVPPPPSLDPAIERRLDCISWHESRHTPSARNPLSGAAGQYQFLLSTWRSTPQGRAGLSPYDPVAAREAARWMIAQGRIREWVPVQLGLC